MIQKHEAIYPGHPVTIAHFIMRAFPDKAKAFAKGNCQYPNALTSGEVPGAGGNVWGALDFLEEAEIDFDAAVAEANRRWPGWVSRDSDGVAERGQAQADSLVETVRAQFKEWR